MYMRPCSIVAVAVEHSKVHHWYQLCCRSIIYCALREEIEKELEGLQRSGYMEEPNSAHASALVLVQKISGSLYVTMCQL